jgi:hypothetical protein
MDPMTDRTDAKDPSGASLQRTKLLKCTLFFSKKLMGQFVKRHTSHARVLSTCRHLQNYNQQIIKKFTLVENESK